MTQERRRLGEKSTVCLCFLLKMGTGVGDCVQVQIGAYLRDSMNATRECQLFRGEASRLGADVAGCVCSGHFPAPIKRRQRAGTPEHVIHLPARPPVPELLVSDAPRARLE